MSALAYAGAMEVGSAVAAINDDKVKRILEDQR
jgi:hypothetical protein